MEGVDYSSARPSPAGLYAVGKRFVCRYTTGVFNGQFSAKNLTPEEAQALANAGLFIVSNYEGDGHAEIQAGFVSGQACARRADQRHKVCGGPPDAPIYFSADFDVSPSVAARFIDGAVSTLGFNRVGVYGSYRVIEALVGVHCKFGWQTYAWSGGKLSNKTHIYQYHNGVIVAGGECDLDRSLQVNFGQWKPGSEQDMDMSTKWHNSHHEEKSFEEFCRDTTDAVFTAWGWIPGKLNAMDEKIDALQRTQGGLTDEDRALIQANTDALNALNHRLASE